MARKYFGTDGIRGRANSKITADVALRVGQAAGVAFRRGEHRHRVVIGKDTRLSSYMIEYALVAGFTSVGVDVLLLGPVPTPAVAMLTRSMRCDLGVMISASHNPYEDNGIKLFGPDGYKLSDAVEARIEALMDGDVAPMLARSPELGRAKRIDDVQARYIEYAKRTLSREVSLEGMRVVVDCANGAAYKVAPEALWELGAEVIKIGVDPNGLNINLEVGSTAPETLARKVREMRADVGIALDGDADRMIIVDEKGHLIDGDQVMAVIAESWRDEGRLAKPGIVATVMSNLGLERHLAGLGLALERTAVGDRYVIERMREKGFNVGGEQSGHIILSDYATTGDGLVAALQVLAVVHKIGKPVSEVCRRFEPVPQVLAQCPFQRRQAAGASSGRQGDRGGDRATRRSRAARHPAVRHRAGDPGHGRSRRQGAGRHPGQRRLRGGRRSGLGSQLASNRSAGCVLRHPIGERLGQLRHAVAIRTFDHRLVDWRGIVAVRRPDRHLDPVDRRDALDRVDGRTGRPNSPAVRSEGQVIDPHGDVGGAPFAGRDFGSAPQEEPPPPNSRSARRHWRAAAQHRHECRAAKFSRPDARPGKPQGRQGL